MALAMLCIAISAGCAQVRLPAIDPSGRSIFLPASSTTTLATDSPVALPSSPQPAFGTPPQPPACPDSIVASSPVAHHGTLGCGKAKKHSHSMHDLLHPARKGQIVLMPKRVVAPVGGEVVLVSGLSGSKGKLVKGQPLEWVLSQESVGHFVQVGKPKHSLLGGLPRKSGTMLSASFARSQTTHKARTVTRGTATEQDDVNLTAGQSWITLSSPSEGVSHVTVMAPNAEHWDKRRETATVYWVDARWDLPPAASVRAGQIHTLQTRVARNAAGVPAEGWIVRYELAPGSSAAFLPNAVSVVETLVDANGVGAVQIQSSATGSDAARVRVQVVRPADAQSGLPRMIVGQGWTTVTWNAPGLVLQATGPSSARPGDTLTYQIQVSNPGNLATRGVVVVDEPPAGLNVVSSNPAFEQFGERHQWQIGDLGPGQTRVIVVQCRLELNSTFRYTFRAQSADGLTDQKSVETAVIRPTLSLQMSGPQQAQVGETVTYEVRVRNTSGRDLSEVTVTDAYDAGLQQSEGAASPIRRNLGAFRPEEEKAFSVSFIVRQPGVWCHVLDAAAPDGFTIRSRACVRATAPPQPAIDVQMTGPPQQQVGQFALFTARITNRGNVPLTQVTVAMTYDPSLRVEQASDNYRVEQNRFLWTIPQIPPGQSEARQLNCRCIAPNPAAVCRADVTSAENATDAASVQTRIFAAPQPQPTQPAPIQPAPTQPGLNAPTAPSRPVPAPIDPSIAVPRGPINAVPGPGPSPTAPARPGGAANPGGSARSGESGLQVTIADSQDPVRVGEETSYLIVVTNRGQGVDGDVILTVRLPDGLELVNLQGPVGARASGDGGRTLEMTPIRSMRANERLRPFRIVVRATKPGELSFRAEVRSRLQPQAVVTQESTTVLGP